MQLKGLFISLFILLYSLSSGYSQQPYYNKRPDFLKANSIWSFGVGAGLDFNSGGPLPISTEMFSQEGCASVADPLTGKLLFYSNGGQVWNANHQIMPNGNGLLGNESITRIRGDNHYSTRQGVCIVPVINDPGKYYLFSLSGNTSGGPKPEGTLFYNVIDMSLNSGLGDIVPGKKNISLDADTLSEAMIAIPGDSCDIWLMVHLQKENLFKAYHITEDGIDPVPVISNSGYYSPNPSHIVVCMNISPDRSKIVFANAFGGVAFLGQFDPATGQVTNAMRAASGNYYGAAFSPDNTKLYFNSLNEIHQYDLSVYDSVTIHNSRTFIGTGQFSGSVRRTAFMNIMRLYNDTIYVGFFRNIHRINQPNLAGTACDFQLNAIQLLPGDTCSGSLNSEVVWPLVDTVYEPAQVTSCIPEAAFTFNAPQGYDGYEWEDGSTSATRTITTSGTYWVISKDFCRPRVDTFVIWGLNFIPPVINIDVRELGTTAFYDTYQWMFEGELISGATDSIYTVTENGNYQVIVTSEEGCIDTSEVYVVTNVDENENSIENMDKIARQIRIYPNPAKDVLHIRAPFAVNAVLTGIDGRIMKMYNDVNAVEVSGLSDGMYFLRLTDREGRLLKVEKVNIRH